MKTDPKYKCWTNERLDSIQMTAAERAAAKTYLEQGVRVADMAGQIGAWVRSIAERVRRGFRGLRRVIH